MRALLVALVAAHINAQCPSPYEGTSTDACFLISDFPATFSQCQQHCESNGGSLATIKSKQEDDYVRQLVTTQRAVWIGLFESGEQDESGVWEWVNGMSSTWRNWQPGEPNEWCTDEDCGLMAPGLWDGWVDASCTIPNWAHCLCRRGQLAGSNYRRDRVRLDQNAHDYDNCKDKEEEDPDEDEDQAGYFRYCRENGLAPKNWDARRQAYPYEDEKAAGYQAGTCGFAAWERDEQWAVCCCVDPTFCCAWGEDENCKSRDEEWEDEDAEWEDEELVERVDAMKREVDALMALVVVLLVVVGALVVYLVPWRRRPAFASPSLSVELNPTTYNELGRGSVEGI